MNNILGNFDRNNIKSFWELNKEFLNIENFYVLFKEDKSKSKKNSSLIMWALALLNETDGNPLSKLPEKERIENIEKVLDIKINLLSLQSLMDLYIRVTKSVLEQELHILDKKLHERIKLLNENEYSLENVEKLDKVILNTDKLTEQYKKLETAVKAEQEGDHIVKGGRKESMSEKGELFN